MILFIDDDEDVEKNDVEDLISCGYDVHLEQTVDGAIQFLLNNRQKIDGVICDIMMPHGKYFSAAETNAGFRTGVKLFEWARERWPDLRFVILTNLFREEVRERFKNEHECIYLAKQEFIGDAFTEQVRELIPVPIDGKQS